MLFDDPLVIFNGEKDKTVSRKLIASAGGTSGFKKRYVTNLDGSVTRLDTKDGMPQITIDRKETPVRVVSEFSTLLYSELRPNGVLESSRNVSTLELEAGNPYHVKISGSTLYSALAATPDNPARGVVSWASDAHVLQTGLPFIEPEFRTSREPYPSTTNSVLYRYYASTGVDSSTNAGNSIDGAAATLGQTEYRSVEGAFRYGLDGVDVPLGPDGQKPSTVSERMIGGVQTRTFLNCGFIANGDGTKSFRVLEWVDASGYVTDFTIADSSLFAGKKDGAVVGVTRFAFSRSGRKLAIGFYYETIHSPDAENRVLGWDHNDTTAYTIDGDPEIRFDVYYSYLAAGVIEINVDTMAVVSSYRNALPREIVDYTSDQLQPPVPTSLHFEPGRSVESVVVESFGYYVDETLSVLTTTFVTSFDGQSVPGWTPVYGVAGSYQADISNSGHHVSAVLAFSTGQVVATWAYDVSSTAFANFTYNKYLHITSGASTKTVDALEWRDVKIVRGDYASGMFVVLFDRHHHEQYSHTQIATRVGASDDTTVYPETFSPREMNRYLEYLLFDINTGESYQLLSHQVEHRATPGYFVYGELTIPAYTGSVYLRDTDASLQWGRLPMFSVVKNDPANMLHLAVGFNASSTLGVVSILAVDNRYDANMSLKTPIFDDIHSHNFVIRKASRTAAFSVSPLTIDGNYPGQKKWLSPLFIPN